MHLREFKDRDSLMELSSDNEAWIFHLPLLYSQNFTVRKFRAKGTQTHTKTDLCKNQKRNQWKHQKLAWNSGNLPHYW